MYLIFLLIAVIVIAGIIAYYTENSWQHDWTYPIACIATLGGVLFFALAMFAIPVQRTVVMAKLAEHEELRAMNNSMQLRMAVTDDGELQTVSWKQTIAASNTSLASMKYWASSDWTSVYYPRAVLSTQPIR